MKKRVADSLFSTTAILLILILAAAGLVGADDCSQNVDIELPYAASLLSCQVVWPGEFNFILRHYYDKSIQRLSILLSANYAANWFAMGFSPTGSMVGSSAMVGYMSTGGPGVIRQYYLAARTSDQVFPFEGNLTVAPNSSVTLQSQTMYMAFQIDINESLAASSKVIYAYADSDQRPNETTGHIEKVHQARSEMSFDFTTGSASSISNPTDTLRKSHGVINIFAWALLAPVGAFIARYLRQRPLWFFLHVGFQISSFLLALTGVVLGIKLTHELPTVDWKDHRILGISVLVLGILQIIALCARPGKDSKARNLWNWYHFIVGRVVLLLAAINIVVGLNLAGAGSSWRAGYGIILVITLVSFMIMEPIYWYKWFKQRRESRRPMANYEMM